MKQISSFTQKVIDKKKSLYAWLFKANSILFFFQNLDLIIEK
jgi:hypothetical protein